VRPNMSDTRIPISPELVANVQRFKDRPWHDSTTQAFEQGTIPTKPAAQPTASSVRANRIIPRQRLRSPDRAKSRDRRRRLGGSSALPDTLRHLFTEGQRAALCIIMMEIKRRGICDWPIDKIAAQAGVCRTMVQTTLHEARRVGLVDITERPMRGQKSLTNLIRIISKEWLVWIRRAPTRQSAE
jgi:hypothetical protein